MHQIWDQCRRDSRELIDSEVARRPRNRLDYFGLNSVVVPLPCCVTGFTLVQNMGGIVSYKAAFAAKGITPAKTFSGIELHNPQTGTMNKDPIAKSSEVSRQEEMSGCRVERRCPHFLALIWEGRKRSSQTPREEA
ncbi:hypothetical protein TNCT_166581 [Trichonephila clavata]|uniref:Uncharacterized protein n=1 Tax=Trichonephila clavata TaxID=2740835 RepID=A0A8X6L985_TRICU|nr:hypothetical protein TNCT_166581 [Trichonephila clavata]